MLLAARNHDCDCVDILWTLHDASDTSASMPFILLRKSFFSAVNEAMMQERRSGLGRVTHTRPMAAAWR